MKILVTAGNTQVPIDTVRCISNIFKGRTGTNIAIHASKNHEVTLIGNSYSKQLLEEDHIDNQHINCTSKWINFISYKTFDELESAMEKEIRSNNYDIIIHSAAVSDYTVEGTYKRAAVRYDASDDFLEKVDSSKKISSGQELYLKLIPTKKLVDQIRNPWGFKGTLVKFKLQVGISKEELLNIARASRIHSKADFIVANVLDDFNDHQSANMFIVGENICIPCSRENLSSELLKVCI